nr:MmcQ/YjbR family DNA-binding protein [Burkholderia cenocepacia]
MAWRGVEDGTPALKVKGKVLARLREDGDTLVVKGVGPDERAWLIESAPDVYYVTDHYVGWPIVLVRLSAAHPDAVKNLLLREWHAIVPATWRDDAARGAN